MRRRNTRVAGIVSAIIFGILGWSVVGIVGGLTLGLVVWLVWSGRGFVAGLVVGFAEGEGSPRGPFESWRKDRLFGLVTGFAFGFVVGLVEALVVGALVGGGVAAGLGTGLTISLTVGLVYGITSSETWSTSLAWLLQRQRSRQVPAVGLMSFSKTPELVAFSVPSELFISSDIQLCKTS